MYRAYMSFWYTICIYYLVRPLMKFHHSISAVDIYLLPITPYYSGKVFWASSAGFFSFLFGIKYLKNFTFRMKVCLFPNSVIRVIYLKADTNWQFIDVSNKNISWHLGCVIFARTQLAQKKASRLWNDKNVLIWTCYRKRTASA